MSAYARRSIRSLSSRKRSFTRLLGVGVLLGSSVLAGCGGPFVLLPGGELDGTTSPVPADWSASDEISTIQLETRPDEPYSVNIWAVGLGTGLYVHAGANRAAWVGHMETDPRVRVRLGEKLHLLTAKRVTDPAEFSEFANAYESKYRVRPRNENVAEVFLYRLERRGDE